jgi:hypothetical protein
MVDDRLPDDFEPEQLALYHAVYSLALPNRALFAHPKATPVPDEHWRTLCHNFAFCAAQMRDGGDITVVTDDDEVLMTSERGTPQ